VEQTSSPPKLMLTTQIRVGQSYRLVQATVYAGLKGIMWHDIIFEIKRYGLIEWTTQTNPARIPHMP